MIPWTMWLWMIRIINKKQNHIKPGEHILEMIYAFLVETMKRVWGYTLFWMGIGMLIMFFVGGGPFGILLIAGIMLVSYLLFSC